MIEGLTLLALPFVAVKKDRQHPAVRMLQPLLAGSHETDECSGQVVIDQVGFVGDRFDQPGHLAAVVDSRRAVDPDKPPDVAGAAGHFVDDDREVTYQDEVMAYDRALGSRLAGDLARRPGIRSQIRALHLRFGPSSIAGNGFAAWNAEQMDILIEGGAQDGVAKGAARSGGLCMICPLSGISPVRACAIMVHACLPRCLARARFRIIFPLCRLAL